MRVILAHSKKFTKNVPANEHGRPIADIWVKGRPIDQELLDEGLAVRMSE